MGQLGINATMFLRLIRLLIQYDSQVNVIFDATKLCRISLRDNFVNNSGTDRKKITLLRFLLVRFSTIAKDNLRAQ